MEATKAELAAAEGRDAAADRDALVSRRLASRIAAITGSGMMLIGLAYVLVPRLTVDGGPQSAKVTRSTVVDADGKETRITSSEPADSGLEGTVGSRLVVLGEVGAVLIGAFGVGAIVHRALLGNYAFKVGGLDLPSIPHELPQEIAKQTFDTRHQVEALQGVNRILEEKVRRLTYDRSGTDDQLAKLEETVRALNETVRRLERRT